MGIFSNKASSLIYRLLTLPSTGSNLAITFVTNMFLSIVSLLSGLLIARWLGPEGRGELAAIQAWPTFIAVIGVIGIPDALVYFSAKQPNRVGQYLTTSISVALLSCVPFVIFGYIFMPFVLSAQSLAVIKTAQIYLLLVPLMAIVGMFPHPLRGINNIRKWNILRSFPSVTWLVIILVLGFFGLLTTKNLSFSYLIGLILLIFPLALLFSRWVNGPYSIEKSYIKPMLIYGIPAALSVIPVTLNLRLDQMIMPAFIQSEQLGYYAVAVAWSGVLIPILSIVPALLLPRVAREEKQEYQLKLLTQATRLTIPFIIGVSIIIAFLSPFGIQFLFGSVYLPATIPAIILSIGAGLLGVNQLLETGAMSLGKPKFVLYAEIFGLVVTIILLYLLLPILSILGAAIASFTSYLIVTCSLLIILGHHTRLGLKQMIIPRRQDFLVLSAKINDLLHLLSHSDN